MRPLRALVLAVPLALAALPAGAVQPSERLDDPALEARARALSTHLRCMVCQNQSIDDSDAQLAKDLRVLVRERVAAGDTDDEVIDFLVARYGEFVLLKPRLQGQTLILWLAPPVLLAAAGFGAFLAWRRRAAAKSPAETGLTPEEQARLDALLERGETKASP